MPTLLIAQVQTFVPDDNFEQALIDFGYDTAPLDNYVPTANIESVTFLGISYKNISDLTGIEYFRDLTSLQCRGNNLTNLDISNNTALTFLDCGSNNLSSLSVSNNIALEELSCDNNNLTSLDISNNTALEDLFCSFNNLTSLDVSNNILLGDMRCGYNNITNLDVSNNIELEVLDCDENNLNSLDLSNNIVLQNLYIRQNNLTSLNISNCLMLRYLEGEFNNLTILDLSNNTELEELYFNNNSLESLNIQNGNNINLDGFSARNNPNLTCIQVDNVSYSNNHLSGGKDEAAIFSINCSTLNTESSVMERFNLYPNPAKNSFTIELNNASELVNVSIINKLGKIIFNSKATSLKTGTLEAGIYLVEVTTNTGKSIKKLIIE